MQTNKMERVTSRHQKRGVSLRPQKHKDYHEIGKGSEIRPRKEKREPVTSVAARESTGKGQEPNGTRKIANFEGNSLSSVHELSFTHPSEGRNHSSQTRGTIP